MHPCLVSLSTSVVLVSIRQILLVIVLFLERILESSLVLVLGGSNVILCLSFLYTCFKFSCMEY